MVDARDGTVMFAKRRRLRALDRKHHQADDRAAGPGAAPSPATSSPRRPTTPCRRSRGSTCAPGEQMTVHDLLEALLLESANDAAVTLAEGISGSREAFVEEMNARAAELGLEHTSYANPIGLDEAGNYSTARDLAMPDAGAAAATALRTHRRHAAGAARVGATAARGRQPQRPGRDLSVGERREDRLHAERGQRAGGLGERGRRRARDQRGARRAQRGGARHRHADAAALGPAASSTGCRCSTRGGRSRSADIEYRDGERPAGAAPRRRAHGSRRRADPAARACARRSSRARSPPASGSGTVTVRTGREAGAARGAGHGRRRPRSGDIAGCSYRCLGVALDLAARSSPSSSRRVLAVTRLLRVPDTDRHDDHHRHPQRRDRQDARRAELPARPPPPSRRADAPWPAARA